MGFFNSRRLDEDENHVTASISGNDKSVVKVIRSRFYGKHKGKEREEQRPRNFISQSESAAQTLSNTTSTIIHVPAPSSPQASNISRVAGPSILRNHNQYSTPSTPSRKKPPLDMLPPTPTSARTKDSPISHSRPSGSRTSPLKNADSVTVNLAQRLNELAVANSEGLLNDDEYRLLRQNLFERFSTTSFVPTENPVVPAAARPRPLKNGPFPETRPHSRVISNFQIDMPRPTSVHSKASATTGMVNLFRRATGRRTPSISQEFSDTSSIWSGTSTASNIFKLSRVLSKKSSDSSVRTSMSRGQADAISISSRRVGNGASSDRDPDSFTLFSPSGSRSASASVRRFATPPSSFPSRTIGQENRYAMNVNTVIDEENFKSSKEIQDEILGVEAEARRLMNAFNGLEMTTLARQQRQHSRPSHRTGDPSKSVIDSLRLNSDGRSQIRIYDDATSVRSVTSIGTTPSTSRSIYSSRKVVRQKTSLNASITLNSTSRPSSLHRKTSSSSLTSDRRAGRAAAPPVPALPSSYGMVGVASASNGSLIKSSIHLPMSSVPEDDAPGSVSTVVDKEEVEEDFEYEMDDIRRRREEVSRRYDARLEYLRAKLKGAQLHEKLLRK